MVATGEDLIDRIMARCEGAYAETTLRGYRNDLRQFQLWCAERDLEWLPAAPAAIAVFVDEQVQHLKVSTVDRRVKAIKFAHRMADMPSPTENSVVYLALRRAGRARRRRPEQVLGLTSDLLGRMLTACPNNLVGKRDAALLCVGYDTLCRSSKLSAMIVEHLGEGLATNLVPRTKADPFGDGRIAHLSPPTSERVQAWLDAAEIGSGPLFRGLHLARVSDRELDTSPMRRLIKRAAKRAGLDQGTVSRLSGHSMRVGAAQDMMVAGIDTVAIMQAGG